MTREDFRRELGDAFDSISGSPDPALPDRVRAALGEAPEQHGPVWIAALAAAVIAVILVGVLLVGNPLNRGPRVPGGTVHSTPSPSPAPATSPTPNPSTSPSPTASVFVCGASSVFTANDPQAASFIDALRTGAHTGYDRLTIEFQSGQPGSIALHPQNTATFAAGGGRGGTVTLAGKDGLLITVFSTDAHTTYSGPTDIRTGFKGLLEVRVVSDFEGHLQVGLGLSKPACYRASILTSPTRLAIDIQTGQ